MNTVQRTYIAPFDRILSVAVFLLSCLDKTGNLSGAIAYIDSTGGPLQAINYALALAVGDNLWQSILCCVNRRG